MVLHLLAPKTFLVCILKLKNAEKNKHVLYHRHCHYHCQLLLRQTDGLIKKFQSIILLTHTGAALIPPHVR